MQVLTDVFNTVVDFAVLIGNSFYNTCQFIIAMLKNIPELIINMFSNMPHFFQYGIESIMGVIVLVVVLKIVALLLSFK